MRVVCWAADIGAKLEGDFVECGVNLGGQAMTVLRYTGLAKPRRFWLLDTFNGFVTDYLSEAEKTKILGMHGTRYGECFERVRQTFAPYDNVVLVRGAVPDTLPKAAPERVAYLSIDMNCARPEVDAAEHFWPRMVPGALIVLDDYGWPGHEEQRAAFDDFARRHRAPLLPLPTGQGLIFKS